MGITWRHKVAQANAGRGQKGKVAGMIEVLKYLKPGAIVPIDIQTTKALVDALRQVIVELESQEPVALPCCGYRDASAVKWNPLNDVVQCHNCGQTYTPPPQRTWVGLTDEEAESYWDWEDFQTGAGCLTILKMVRDIEAKLKEKNS